MNPTRPALPEAAHANSLFPSFPSGLLHSGKKLAGLAALVAGVAFAIFRYMQHRNSTQPSGSTVQPENSSASSKRVIERLEIDAPLASAILSKLGITYQGGLEIPKEGRIASNVIVSTDRGRYVLRLYPKGCQDTKLETGNVDFEAEALRFLSARGVAVPAPEIFPETGSPILEISGAKVLVYPVIPGDCIRQEELSVPIARRSGELLHSMIEASSQFHAQAGGAPEGDAAYILGIAERLLERIPSLRDSPDFAAMVKVVSSLNLEEQLKKTPQGIVHGDFFFENILKNGDDPLSIIDFGDAYYGALVMDIVTSSMEFSVLSDGSWDLKMFSACLSPHADWLKTHRINSSFFHGLLLANCLRFSIYTLPGTLEEGMSVSENPYVARFQKLLTDDFSLTIKETFSKIVGE